MKKPTIVFLDNLPLSETHLVQLRKLGSIIRSKSDWQKIEMLREEIG